MLLCPLDGHPFAAKVIAYTPIVFPTPILSHLSTNFRRREQRAKPITTWRTQDCYKKKSRGRQSRQSCECEADEYKGGRGWRELEYYATYVCASLCVLTEIGTARTRSGLDSAGVEGLREVERKDPKQRGLAFECGIGPVRIRALMSDPPIQDYTPMNLLDSRSTR